MGWNRRRLLMDKLAGRGVLLGGWVIIASILAILLVIVFEIYPLFLAPKTELKTALATGLDSPPLAVGIDRYQQLAYVVNADGIHFFSLENKRALPSLPLAGLEGARISSAASGGKNRWALGLSDGRVLPVQVQFHYRYKEGVRSAHPALETMDPLVIQEEGSPVVLLTYAFRDSGFSISAVTGPDRVVLVRVQEQETMMGTREQTRSQVSFSLPVTGEISALVLNPEDNSLLAGTTSGQILRAGFDEDAAPESIEIIGATAHNNIAVTCMGFVLGNYTLAVGDSGGGVTSYQLMKGPDGKLHLRRIHEFSPHNMPVRLFSPSRRNKGFISGSTDSLKIHYATTGVTQLGIDNSGGPGYRAVTLSPKGNSLMAADSRSRLFHWTLVNPYPQVTYQSLFGKIWYEGYSGPEYVWQSTGGTDAFEPKFSLVPLIFGTLKGTFYAMLFAAPVAFFGAFYTSQFMNKRFRGMVKPAIEMMAALPSVILGFFAALIIAPEVERFLPGIALVPFVILAMILAGVWGYKMCEGIRGYFKNGMEITLLVPLVLIAGVLSFYLGTWVEANWLQGDYRNWLQEVFQTTYDQRNTLVVGLAMGFAVIPIIFTITEDSLSNVPDHLKASSLALGATPWQTAVKVVLPTASPGIFSAIMIGFGRAVGETMIVLMATGNTPVMNWNIFRGFRALSANIAVELPEAPEGGTLFRVLFLAAFLLFVMTFLVNTIAELVRLRLRKKYRVL
ncbi:MAG: ABC transporter permease subunit [Nitrospinaceae bacterium]